MKNIKRFTYPYTGIKNLTLAFVKFICGLIGVLTLGYVIPDWDTNLLIKYLIESFDEVQ